jgi:hypothetical protein
MATDEEIEQFVNENRELVERMMKAHRESFETLSDMNRQATEEAFETTYRAAEMARQRSEEFFKATVGTIASPVVQRHFMNASLEFLAGLTAIAETAPFPDFVRDAADDIQKTARQTACRRNEDCPFKNPPEVEVEAAPDEQSEE